MNIWYKFEQDPLIHRVLNIDWHPDLGPRNVWCKKDPLQTKGLRAHARTKKTGPLVATNETFKFEEDPLKTLLCKKHT